MIRLTFLCTLALCAGTQAQKNLLVRAGKAWLSPDRTLTHASILVEGGKIADMASRKSASERSALRGRADEVLDFPNGVATAGFVDVHSWVGATGELAESVESFTPELRAARAYDPFAPAWKRITKRGVTTVVLAPNDSNLAGGISAAVKPGKLPGADSDSYLKMSLTTSALNRERRPTSIMGAQDYLREGYASLEGVKPADLAPAQRAIAETLGGGRTVGIACRSPREIHAALKVMASYQLSGFLIHVTEIEKCLAKVKAATLPVVLAPLGFDSSRKALRLPALLAGAGIAFAFAGETATDSDMPRLQVSLAMAIRNGVTEKDALASVTTVPAQLAGISERAGTLFKGRDADICIWSGAPWDLRSKLLAVVSGGRVAYRRK